jgi:hypothetical protein
MSWIIPGRRTGWTPAALRGIIEERAATRQGGVPDASNATQRPSAGPTKRVVRRRPRPLRPAIRTNPFLAEGALGNPEENVRFHLDFK